MSIEEILSTIQNLIQQIEAMKGQIINYEEILQAKEAKNELLSKDNIAKATEIKSLKEIIAGMREDMEDLEREKWSFQSELENLRGY